MSLAVGEIAPDFRLTTHLGEEVVLSELVTEKPVVLVFFPLAFSGICTGELCELRDNLTLFEGGDVQLVGISVDSSFAQRAWAEAEDYRFPLLSDFWPHGSVAKQYGVFVEEAGIAKRGTFVITQDRVVQAAFVNEPGEARDFAAYRAALNSLGRA
jgi:peroxiredoxin